MEATQELSIESKLRQIASPTARAYLTALTETGIMRRACRAVKCSNHMPTYWRRHVEHFAELEREARRIGEESLIEAAYCRAVEGMERLKFSSKGDVLIDPRTDEPYVEREYSDALLARLLEAARPEQFRTRPVEGDVAVSITVILEDLRAGSPEAEAPLDIHPAPAPLPSGEGAPEPPAHAPQW